MNKPTHELKPSLSLFDAVSLMIGIVVGVGIFETTSDIAAQFNSITAVFTVWILGAILSLCGALCYAELAATHPKNGGDYVYLTNAFGSWLGFLFVWGRIAVVQPGTIAAIAFPFAHFFIKAIELIFGWDLGESAVISVAVSAVLILTLLNCLGVKAGTRTQNALTILKVAGLLLVSALALFLVPAAPAVLPSAESSFSGAGLALILVMFTFGGWSDIAYVAAEVENNQRNIPRAIILSVVAVTILYLFANAGFFWALGLEGVASSEAVAVDALVTLLPGFGQTLVAALISISALGTMNALLFTGARISHALGLDFPVFRFLSLDSGANTGPIFSILLLGICSACIIVLVGSFERTVVYTTPVVWMFYLLSTIGLMILRRKENSGQKRPFSVPFYPLLPVCFILACLYICYAAIEFEWLGSAISLGILSLGIPLYKLTIKQKKH